jgi:hypothetical protein
MPWPFENHHCGDTKCKATISKKKGKGYCDKHQRSCSNGHDKWIYGKNESCHQCKRKVNIAADNAKKDKDKVDKEQEKKDKKRDPFQEVTKGRKKP